VPERVDDVPVPVAVELVLGRSLQRRAELHGVLDDGVDVLDLVLRIAAFFRDESCGQCVPCRVGTVRQEEALHRLARSRELGSREHDLGLLADVAQVMRDASICGLGQTAANAVASAIERLDLFGPDGSMPGPGEAIPRPTEEQE
jgi:NADH-quinone oxidoreductase subunit F